MRTPSTPLLGLVLASQIGVLLIVGLVVHALLGMTATLLYLLVSAAGLALLSVLARRRVQRERAAAGRTCSCCTTSVHDPVRVI